MSTTNVWTDVLKQHATEVTKEYFAPFVGAWRGAVTATQKVQRENRKKRIDRLKARQELKSPFSVKK